MVVSIRNSKLRVDVRVEHGAEVTFVGAPDGWNHLERFEGDSPIPAGRGLSYGSTALDWLSAYRGGWQELIPNAGDECEVMQCPLPFHGEGSTASWDVTSHTDTALTVSTPLRLPLIVSREMTIVGNRPVLQIRETVRNESNMPIPFLWGHHPAYKAAEGMAIDLPSAVVTVATHLDTDFTDLLPGSQSKWPMAASKMGGTTSLSTVPRGPCERVVFLTELSAHWYALRSPDNGRGLAMTWDPALFPVLWMWTEIGGKEFPWYGRSSILALEPATACPADGLAAAVDRGDAHVLEPGGARSAWLTLATFEADERPVVDVSQDGDVSR